MKIRCLSVFLLLCSISINQHSTAADGTTTIDAAQEAVAGVLDVSAMASNLSITNISSLTQIITASGQTVCLDGLELQVISEADATLTISGNGAVDILNSSLSLPNDGSSPTVANLLALEFEGLAASNSLVPERLTVGGSHSDAIAAFWIQLDQLYVGANDFYNLAINSSFVYLGNDYARYLAQGNEARLDIVKIGSDRLQTLHDNLLGNLGDGPIASRFTNLSEPDPRTAVAASFGKRLYNRGTATAGLYTDQDLLSAIVGWDLDQQIAYPTTLPFPFAVLDSASSVTGTADTDVWFPGGGDDAINAGLGVDTVAYSGKSTDYQISSTGGRFVVADGVENRDGSDTLDGVERLRFTDGVYFLVGGNDYTIQAAIDAANSGDSIVVAAGTHSEALIINKPLSLIGEQEGIDGRGRSGSAETILQGSIILQDAADGAVIDGMTITEGGNIGGENAGVFLSSGASGVTVRNTVFSRSGVVDGDSYRGILTTSNGGNNNLLITRNSFSGWATGIYLNPAATDAVVSNNRLDGNFVGMSIDGPSNTNVINNDFLNNQFEGLGIGPGVSNPSLSFAGNDFQRNTTQIGIYTTITLDLSVNTFDVGVSIGQSSFVYSAIQNAIDAASEGDTIHIDSGTYTENISINKPLTLAGAGTSTIVSPASGNAIAITGNILAGNNDVPGISGVVIENLDIVGASGGFGIIALSNAVPADQYDTADITIRHVNIDTSAGSFAIGLFDVKGVTVENVDIGGYSSDVVGALELVGVADLTINSTSVDGDALSLKIFEVDGYAQNGTVQIRNSVLASMVIEGGEADVDARENWWGSASSPSDKIIGDALFDPWFVNVSLTQLSNFVPPAVAIQEPDPVDEVEQIADDIVNEIDDIVLPDEGGEVSQETVDAIDNVLDDVKNLAEDSSQRIESGELSTDEAVTVLNTLKEVIGLAGNAASQGAGINQATVRDSVASVTAILDAVGNGEELGDSQVEQLQQVAEGVVNSVSDLVDADSTEEEVEALVGDVEALLSSAGNAGAGLAENVVTAAKTLSQKAFDNTLDNIAVELGIEESVDVTNIEATQQLLEENSNLLDRVLKASSVELPSSIELDTAALTENLENGGLDAATADELTNNLSQFVNPLGVNLELGNGSSVNALDAMVDSVGDSSTNISVDALTGSLLVDVGTVSVPVNVSKVSLVPAAVPEGVSVLPDGSALSVSNGVAVTIVPAPRDPVGLVSALSVNAGDVQLKSNGGIEIAAEEGRAFSGTFGFDDVQSGGGNPVAEVTLNLPDEGDPADPNFLYTVDYPDGSSQTISPFIADENFFDSLGARGLSFNTSRNTGVVTVVDESTNGAAQFRPDYFVAPLTDDAQNFLDTNADETGVAYRAVDANGDGIQDFEVISPSGVQFIYGVP